MLQSEVRRAEDGGAKARWGRGKSGQLCAAILALLRPGLTPNAVFLGEVLKSQVAIDARHPMVVGLGKVAVAGFWLLTWRRCRICWLRALPALASPCACMG